MAHEFGHTLGLRHSSEEGALMFAVFNKDIDFSYVLHQDDKNGIRALYGKFTSQLIFAFSNLE